MSDGLVPDGSGSRGRAAAVTGDPSALGDAWRARSREGEIGEDCRKLVIAHDQARTADR